MISLIRPFLVFLLMLLQFAAPLIHAHKNSIQLGTFIHLPEFEQVNALLKHAPEFIAPTNHDDGIMAISTGIKNETLQFLQTENAAFVLLFSLFFTSNVKRKQLYFLFQIESISDSHFFNLALPRAPPFFTIR